MRTYRTILAAAAVLTVGGCALPGGEPSADRLYTGLTDEDVRLAAAAMQQGLETARPHQSVAWINDRSGNSGAVTPIRTYLTDAGMYCRVYRETLKVGGEAGQIVNTGCRSEDGLWIWVE